MSRWSDFQESIYRTIMDSEFLEPLQRAETEDDFEYVISELAHEIMINLGETDPEPWTRREALEFKKQILQNEINRGLDRMKQIDAELNK